MANWDVLFVSEGKQLTDVDEAEVRQMLSAGELQDDDCIRRTGESRWRRVAELKGRTRTAEESNGSQQEAKSAAAATPVAAKATSAVHDEEDDVMHTPRHTEVEPLDMTPMVDVVLLLLLFFMVTASYALQRILESPKPNPEKTQATTRSRNDLMKEYVILEIDHRNQFLVEDEPLKGRRLPEALKTAITETGKNKLLIIADGASFHGSTIKAIDAGNEVNVIQPIVFSVRTDE